MQHFSQTSAAAACSGLSQSAQSTANKIQATTSAGAVGDVTLQKQLSFLSARLQLFRQHVDQLGRCIADADTVHPQLGDTLTSSFAECQDVLGIVSSRLGPGTGGLGVDALTRYGAFVAAHSRLFVFGTQLLTIDIEQEQQLKLVHADARDLLDGAHSTAQGVLSFKHLTEN